jgi:hypothetical protein
MSTVRSGIASVSVACCLVLAGVARGAQPGSAGTDTFVRVFTIGGTVSGLTGSGLVLSDLGMVAQISANGEFTFPTFMPKGAKYDVSVTHQPGSPAQVCTVTNGSGVVTTTNITNIAVACEQQKHWHAAQEIGQSIGDSRDAKVATGPSGNALAVWTLQPDPFQAPIGMFSNVFTPAGWGSPVQVSPLDSAFRPKLQGDGAGNAFSVWHSFNGTLLNVLWSRYTANVGWSAPALIGNPAASSQVEPQIAVDSRGGAIAVWEQLEGNRFRIVASRFVPGIGWGAAQAADVAPANTHTGDAFMPQIAIDTHGNALIVWQQFDPAVNQTNLWANRYTAADDAWGAAVELGQAQNLDDPDRTPRILCDAHDNALVVWNQPPVGVWADRYVSGSGWQTPVLIGSGANTDHPDVGLDANGNALAVWAQPVASGLGVIWSNRFTTTAGWGTAAPIESHSGGAAGRVKIAVDTGGNALAVWQQRIDALNTLNVWALRFSSSAGWGSPEEISNGASTAANAEIVFDAQGNAFAVWEQGDSSDAIGVWSNRFDDRQ